jgi:hypothetical protein
MILTDKAKPVPQQETSPKLSAAAAVEVQPPLKDFWSNRKTKRIF